MLTLPPVNVEAIAYLLNLPVLDSPVSIGFMQISPFLSPLSVIIREFKFIIIFFFYLLVWERLVETVVCTWRSEANFVESVFSFHL